MRLGLSGAAGTVVKHVMLYVLTDWCSVWYITSSVVSFMLSCGVSFLLQKYWTFRNGDNRTSIQLGLYVSCSLAYLTFNTVMMFVLVSQLYVHYILSQLILTLVIAVMSYFTTRKIFVTKTRP